MSKTLLAKLETELRREKFWDGAPPSIDALNSQLPFCVDTLNFTQWLQWIYIPRLKALHDGGGELPHLPAGEGIRPYAEEAMKTMKFETPMVVLETIGSLDELMR